jgi:ParB family chromosome partitioning protein
MDTKFQTYRGEVKSLVGVGGTVAFVTVHAEGQPTALYRLDADKLQLKSDTLPTGGRAVVADEGGFWIAGTDGHVYHFANEKLSAVGDKLDPAPVALAVLAKDRLAVLTGSSLVVLAKKDGKLLQTLPIPETGSALAVDPTGQWVVAGTAKGNVVVFEGEDRDHFEVSASEKLHEGAVTALLFEPQELRFYSAGADNKLLSTHARGKLEPEDKGRGGNHGDQITGIVWGPGDRFFTSSRDKTVKSWPRATNLRPNTLKDNVIKATGLAVVQLGKKTQLVVACDDNTLRFFAIDEEGKFGDAIVKLGDAYARARSELNRDETTRREAALRALASYNDTPAVEMIGEQINTDGDHGLRVLCAELLGSGGNVRAIKFLEKALNHRDEAVRVAAFKGLCQHLGEEDLRPIDLALKAEVADVGRLAVRALEKLAPRDDQAMSRLMDALNVKTREVRQAAMFSLEKLHPGESPEANLIALASTHGDLRRLTLIRLFQRKMLNDARVQSVLRWRLEDSQPEVRQTAFLLSLYTRVKLVEALRRLDPELQRLLAEIEALGPDGTPAKVPEAGAAQADKPTRRTAVKLAENDFDPLLQATASRALDTCLRGARGLAVLHDPRAFGLLLQLSREDAASARIEVSRAFGLLGDPRAIKRLGSLLFDKDKSVRDSAFSSLLQLYDAEPLRCAELGLTAEFEDVRKRGLQVLIATIRKSPPAGEDDPSWQLLVRALNDSFPAVRSEAFKAAVNAEVAGGGPGTLRFVLQSIHADVRLEVLVETSAQINEPWAWPLLLTFFNDPDAALRSEAFEFAVKKSKELEPLEAALCSRYLDLRRSAVQALIKKRSKAAQALLVRALDDEEKEIRQLAISALVEAEAEEALARVLESQYADVRVRAATALARYGNRAALGPLLRLASAPEPEQKERVGEWSGLVEQALEGLAELGDPEAVPTLVPLLDSKTASHRKAAARALVWCVRPDTLDLLRTALQHSDPQVKFHAALGLAFAGDNFVAGLVFSDSARNVLRAEERLVAALMLGSAGEDQFSQFLDDDLSGTALLLMMLLELKASGGRPSRCLACLASYFPRVRLTAANVLEIFGDRPAFLQYLVALVNTRQDEQPWKLTGETIEELALLVAHAPALTRARSALLVRLLGEKEQSGWDQAWSAHRRRFAAELKPLTERKDFDAVRSELTPGQLRELAFGAYVGLVREQAARGGKNITAAVLARTRQAALTRIHALALTSDDMRQAAIPVLIQAMGDPVQNVRQQAFEHLQALNVPNAVLGSEALETGHTDMGVKGLEVLTAGAAAEEAQKVIEQVMLARKDDLAFESAKLLIDRRGLVPVARAAFGAAHEPLRLRAVTWLSGEYDQNPDARAALREALDSRYQKVRESAAFALAAKKDSAAFPALVRGLNSSPDANRQRPVIGAMTALGDPRAPDAMLDRIENDPAGTAAVEDLFSAAGNFRRPESAGRLLAMLERNPKWRKGAFQAALTVSGHDQDIDDGDDEESNKDWLKNQHPRHDAILARLMEQCRARSETRQLSELLTTARWSQGPDVQPVLAELAGHPDEDLRREAVEALGFRLRKRGGGAEPLLKALAHADPETQLNAAEGLARAGRAEGLSVLLTAIEFMPDEDQRERAVMALGELGDRRALDMLLKLANEEGNALQEAAAESLGRLGKTERGGEIFKMLERSARGGSLADAALRGLRWLDTHDAWKLIREKAADLSSPARDTAADLLGYNDEPATRELVLKLLVSEPDYESDRVTVLDEALRSARRLWGEESVEPDYAIIQNTHSDSETEESLERVCKHGEAGRILEILPRANGKCQDELARTVISRGTLPAEAARNALGSEDARTCQLAAQMVGRLGSGGAAFEKPLRAALEKWQAGWDTRRHQELQTGQNDPLLEERLTPCLRTLLWAAGRLNVGQDLLVKASLAHPDDAAYRSLRQEAVVALGSGTVTPEVAKVLEQTAQGDDPAVRVLAAEALGHGSPDRATKIAEQMLFDNVGFGRLVSQPGVKVEGVLRSAVAQSHYQGVALPHLLAQGDLDGLTRVAGDKSLGLTTRQGAVEGLAALEREDAESVLVEIGKSDADEELRKTAWRGLRRSRRARKAMA